MNNQQRIRRISELYEAALELELGRREEFLQSECAGDSELKSEVESLLQAGNAASTEHLFPPLFREKEEPNLVGQQVGAYRILQEIGSGGVGVVYLAERIDGEFRRRLALKVVKRGMDTKDILSRFLHERQILAGLEHPNIARLYDGGVTGDGRPYFVMEYVEGMSLTEYSDRHRLTLEQRLLLFQKICSAVQYAHQNLVVHRDIKPGNILVTAGGEVKLLDFGIAKLLRPEMAGYSKIPHTRTGYRLMTPEYAAPEQVRGEAVNTTTDIYALGVLLYELLTGHRPLRLKSRFHKEVERIICEEEPTRPSTVITRKEEIETVEGKQLITPESVCEARKTKVDVLRRKLKGDLDNIVMMAMRKEPARRYSSVEQLSGDIDRYLKNMPVVAGKDTFAYRFAKFVRRHRSAVTSAVIVFLALITGLGVA
ncbi:MAG: serine/threonine protein kinase, partial [Balneolaceae bacterium]